MFFGVPHQGLAVECLVPMIRDSPNRALLESLGKNSPLLCRLQREFTGVIGTKCRQVVSFYETERSSTAQQVQGGRWEMSGPSEVLVEVSSANCGSLRQHPINRNHSEMVKFSSRQDDLYHRVVLALKPLLVQAQSLQTSREAQVSHNSVISLSDDEKSCLRSLSFQEQDNRYVELSYEKNTCEWLLKDSEYQTWLNAPRGLFWIKGSPGTGKSVLMKFAAETAQRRQSADLVVSFFIHGRGVLLQRSPLGVFRALLSSLLRAFPTYLQDLTERFKQQEERFGAFQRKDGWTWTESELERFLLQVLSRGTEVNPVVLYVDALDECGEHDAKRLLQYFTNIMSMVEEEQGLLKICFSSRHYPILGHETIPTLLVEDVNGQDIRLVVRNRLNKLNLRERRHQIEDDILLKAQGGFQWAILVTDVIRNGVLRGLNSASLHQAVTTIPKDLQRIYEFLLSGAEGDEKADMVKLFQWVLFSERPLSAHELREALATSQEMTSRTTSQLRNHPNHSDTVSDFEIRVRHMSRGLVEFQTRELWERYQADGEDWDREAQFIHQSAADFVLQHFLMEVDVGLGLQSVAGMAHFQISRSCLKYITLQDILENSQLSRQELSVKFPLLPYAITFLLCHIENVEQNNIMQADLLELVQWYQPDRLKMLSAVWSQMDPDHGHVPLGWPFVGTTALHMLVGLGSLSSMQTYLDHNTVRFDATDSYGNTPLLLALRDGLEDLALLLLDRSLALEAEQRSLARKTPHIEHLEEKQDYLAHINMANSDGETPLGVAVSTDAHAVILALLDAGANPNAEKGLLFYAISVFDKPLLSDLVKRGVCLDGAVFFAVQTLRISTQSAETDGHEILSTLLNAGANTRRVPGVVEEFNLEYPDDSDEGEDDEAIIVASRYDLVSVVKLLLLHGASPAVKDSEGCYALQFAIEGSSIEVTEVLFRASLESEDMTQMDVNDILFNAIDREDPEDAAALLTGIYRDGILSDILIYCVSRHHFELADLILHSEKGIKSQGYAWPEMALQTALKLGDGSYEMTELLLTTCDIDLSVRNDDGETPVRWCLSHRRNDLVRLLLGTGKVDIHKNDKGDESPFWWTMREGSYTLIQLLFGLDKCNIHMADSMGRTAFWWLTEGRPHEHGLAAMAEAAVSGNLRYWKTTVGFSNQ